MKTKPLNIPVNCSDQQEAWRDHILQKHSKVRPCKLLGSSTDLYCMKTFFTAKHSPASSSKMLVGFIKLWWTAA